MVPHHGTNWAALRLTAQIGRDAVLSESYGRGCLYPDPQPIPPSLRGSGGHAPTDVWMCGDRGMRCGVRCEV